MFEDHRAHAFEVDARIKAIVARRLLAREKFVQLARESFVILAVALRGLAIRFHFSGEVAQGGPGLRAMLAALVPVVRPEGEKNADSDQRDFEEQVEERPSMFSAVQAHVREDARAREHFKLSGRPEWEVRALAFVPGRRYGRGFDLLSTVRDRRSRRGR